MERPASCEQCGFRQIEGSRCRRHAPGPAPRGLGLVQPANWPTVRPQQRCGQGDTEGALVLCRECINWSPQPEPAHRTAAQTEWERLADAGRKRPPDGERRLCVKWAMSPSANDVALDHLTTAADDSCGDGERPKDDQAGTL